MKNVNALLSLIMVFVTTVSAFAHPGHGHHQAEPMGLMHYLSSPIHMIMLLVVVALIAYLAYRKGFLPFKPAEKKIEK